MVMKFKIPIVIWRLLLWAAAETQSAQTNSDSEINQYVTATCTSETVVHSGRPAVSVFNVEKYGAIGDGKHDSTEAFLRAWYAACRKSSAIFLVPAKKKFVVNNLLFQGPCQPGFIFKVDGMIASPQNPESGKNTNKFLQFAEVESCTLMGRGLVDGQGKKMWAGQCKRFNEQLFIQRTAGIERVVKGRSLRGPDKPKPDWGHPAQHN